MYINKKNLVFNMTAISTKFIFYEYTKVNSATFGSKEAVKFAEKSQILKYLQKIFLFIRIFP
jgi:hypothetical protein